MQCSACGAFIDAGCVLCPYCGQICAARRANTPPLIAAHDLPINYHDRGDAPFTFSAEQLRHAGLKKLLLLLIAAEMFIACLVLMTLADGNVSDMPPKGIVTQHQSGVEDARIALVIKPIATPIPTPQTIAFVPAIVIVPPAQPHNVGPTRTPISTPHPRATPTLAPFPTARPPQATALPTPPTSTPPPAPTATLTPINTPAPTAPSLPTNTPTPEPTQTPPAPTPTIP